MNADQNGSQSPNHSELTQEGGIVFPPPRILKSREEAMALLEKWEQQAQHRTRRIAPDEMTRRAKEIYQRHRKEVEPGNIGRMIVIDVESGEYEIDDDEFIAGDRLYDRFPDPQLFGMRIGYKTAYSHGGKMQRMDE